MLAQKDIRDAADDIVVINRAISDVLHRCTAEGLKPADLIVLASAAELACDRAVMITDGCRD